MRQDLEDLNIVWYTPYMQESNQLRLYAPLPARPLEEWHMKPSAEDAHGFQVMDLDEDESPRVIIIDL